LLELAALLAFFSLDDILRVHEWAMGEAVERLESLLSLDLEYGRLFWPVPFFPMLVTAFILLWQLSRTVAVEPARAIRIGLGLLALGVLAEAASAAIHVERGSPADSSTVSRLPSRKERNSRDGCSSRPAWPQRSFNFSGATLGRGILPAQSVSQASQTTCRSKPSDRLSAETRGPG
jgi:hypothetical protein